jgi:uncharacterized protein (DUF924 family)
VKRPDDILRFWFGAEAEKHWFKSTDAFDAEIRRDFEAVAIALAADQSGATSPHPWEKQSPESHLALIIALDQFPRNMYRNTPAAFAWDAAALEVAKRMISRKTDIHLTQKQRPFAYMPLMHSETLADQEACVRLCDARLEDGNTLKFAEIHRDVIARFGRFPHRNKTLGRQTSAEEQAFLDDGGFSA